MNEYKPIVDFTYKYSYYVFYVTSLIYSITDVKYIYEIIALIMFAFTMIYSYKRYINIDTYELDIPDDMRSHHISSLIGFYVLGSITMMSLILIVFMFNQDIRAGILLGLYELCEAIWFIKALDSYFKFSNNYIGINNNTTSYEDI
jgi:hypothetical protein